MGIYQFLRENPEIEMYTLGVIVDQQEYTDRIIGSIITEIGQSAANCIRQWTEDVKPEHFQLFDLTSGAIYFDIADNYKESLSDIVNKNFSIAVSEEKEYEERKY